MTFNPVGSANTAAAKKKQKAEDAARMADSEINHRPVGMHACT
jgi:hypothetical protein